MSRIKISHSTVFALVLGSALIFVASATALAGGGNVLPATAHPQGYTLTDAAAAEAEFNTGPRTSDLLPEGFPFQILNTRPSSLRTFVVRPGTMLYVPLVWFDDSDPVYGAFPDVTVQEEVSDYYFDPEQLGAVYIEIVVDGKVTSLGPEYIAGAAVPMLPTGGNHYTVAAAFLTPLTKGTHTVTIRMLFAGDAILLLDGEPYAPELTYTVTVR